MLAAHVAAVLKKSRALARAFPAAKLSLFVTDAALASAGATPESLRRSLEEEGIASVVIETVSGATVDIPKSAAGDHYLEIGGADSARASGAHTVSGARITV